MDSQLRAELLQLQDKDGNYVITEFGGSPKFAALVEFIQKRDAAKEREVRENELTLALKDSPNSGLYATYYENRVKMIRTSDLGRPKGESDEQE